MPKSRPFRVAGIFYSGMFEYDSKFVYIHLREAQTFFGIKGASGVEVKVDDVDNARGIMKRIYDNARRLPVPHEGLGRDEPQPVRGAAAREAGDGRSSSPSSSSSPRG
jgi:hypothetical protein